MSRSATNAVSHPRAPSPGNSRKQILRMAVPVIAASMVGSVSLSRYVDRRLLFSRGAIIGIAAELAILAILEREQVVRIVRAFFGDTAEPLSLAIFRMAVFAAIFHEFDIDTIRSFSRMPPGLQFAPWGMGALLPHLWIAPGWAKIAGALLLIFSATGFVGLFSRTSALACTVLGFYVFGIPNFYGKVDHDHHLVWFAAILAFSPCGDFLALDAVVAAWRDADRKSTNPSLSSRAYALPLRFVMLLMGVIYFFPGFWKLWQSGFDWFLTDNLPRQLHLFWLWSFDGLWLPSFRIDQHLWLCRIGAVATIFFELSFVFLMFDKRLRVVAAFGGLIFHGATNWLMRISFLSLRVCYVALFDWSWICSTIGRALYRKDLLLVYDSNSLSARRLVGFVRVWDIFGRTQYVNVAGEETVATLPSSPEKPKNAFLVQDTVLNLHMGRSISFSALCTLAQRIPLIWPAVPALYLWSVAERVCAVHNKPITQGAVPTVEATPTISARPQLAGITVIGCMLLVGNTCGGICRRINAWPFTCYPTFSLPPPEQIVSLSVVAVSSSGAEKPVESFGFPYHRFYGLSRNILAIEDPVARNDQLLLLWARAIQTTPELRTSLAVKFYVENVWIDPDRWSRNPRDRTLLFAWYPPADGDVPNPRTAMHFSDTEWQ